MIGCEERLAPKSLNGLWSGLTLPGGLRPRGRPIRATYPFQTHPRECVGNFRTVRFGCPENSGPRSNTTSDPCRNGWRRSDPSAETGGEGLFGFLGVWDESIPTAFRQDLFASMTAARQDPTADASIVNVPHRRVVGALGFWG